MNRIRLLLFSFLLMTGGAWAQETIYHIGVDGLACPFCAYGIEKQLQRLEGVQSVEVELAKAVVVVTMATDKTLSRDQAEQAVQRAGFTLRSFEIVENEASP